MFDDDKYLKQFKYGIYPKIHNDIFYLTSNTI